MITLDEFESIDTRIRESLNAALTSLRTLSPTDYVLFLADADYYSGFDKPDSMFSPYMIDYRLDGYKDETRLTFLANFLSQFYSFPAGQQQVDNNEQRLNMESMVYLHVWESKPFLKKLYRLAHLLDSKPYAWKVKVPNTGKPNFISQNIGGILQAKGYDLADIIERGYHRSLRNAFAHSEYSFDTINHHDRINLHNYEGKVWELKTISFDEWSHRFVFSALLSYHFLAITQLKRISLPAHMGTSTYTIQQPTGTGSLASFQIEFSQERNAFNYLPGT